MAQIEKVDPVPEDLQRLLAEEGDGPIVIAADGFADMPYEVSQRLLGRAIARVVWIAGGGITAIEGVPQSS